MYMTDDYSISCSSSKYRFGSVWAVVCILVYPLGIPVYYFYALYTIKEAIQLHKNDVTSSLSLSLGATGSGNPVILDPHIQSIVLLFEAYEPENWYWEVVETTKRLMLTGVLVLIAQGSAVQIIVGICFSARFLILYDIYQPFTDTFLAQVEAVSQRQIQCVFFWLV
jgi:hypothetical protein